MEQAKKVVLQLSLGVRANMFCSDTQKKNPQQKVILVKRVRNCNGYLRNEKHYPPQKMWGRIRKYFKKTAKEGAMPLRTSVIAEQKRA